MAGNVDGFVMLSGERERNHLLSRRFLIFRILDVDNTWNLNVWLIWTHIFSKRGGIIHLSSRERIEKNRKRYRLAVKLLVLSFISEDYQISTYVDDFFLSELSWELLDFIRFRQMDSYHLNLRILFVSYDTLVVFCWSYWFAEILLRWVFEICIISSGFFG